jgi:hypothetical protein
MPILTAAIAARSTDFMISLLVARESAGLLTEPVDFIASNRLHRAAG